MADYRDIENLAGEVTNLDTARMTLRWALERLNTIEKEKAQIKKSLDLAEESRNQLEMKLKNIEESASSRAKILADKESFYNKLEATMQLLGEGKINIRQLIEKEARIDKVRSEFEEDYQKKFEELDKRERNLIEQWNRRILDLEEQYGGKLAQAQNKYDSLKLRLEQEYDRKTGELEKSRQFREKELENRIRNLEAALKEGEGALEERRKRLEEEYLNKKKTLEENYLKTKSLLEHNFQDRITFLENEQISRTRDLENSWESERRRIGEENKILEKQFASAQGKISGLENRLREEKEKHNAEILAAIKESSSRFRLQIEELEKEKRNYTEAIDRLTKEFSAKEKAWLKEKAELDRRFSEKTLEIEKIAEEKYRSRTEKEINKKQEEIKEVKNDLSGAQKEVEEKKAIIEEISLKKAELEKAFSESSNAANNEIIALKAKYEKELSGAKAQIQRLESRAADREKEMENLEIKALEAKKLLDSKTEDLNSRERWWLREKAQLDKNFAERVSEIEKLTQEKYAKVYENEIKSREEEIVKVYEEVEKKKAIIEEISLKKADLERILSESANAASREMSEIRAKYESELGKIKFELQKAAGEARNREAEIKHVKAELSRALKETEERKAAAEELSLKKAELEKAFSESSNASHKEIIEIKTRYEGELSSLKSDMQRVVGEAKSRGKELILLQTENESLKEKLRGYSEYIINKEKEIEEEYSGKKNEVLILADKRMANLEKELNREFESQRQMWTLEKNKLNEMMRELKEENSRSRESERTLSAENQRLNERVVKAEAEFNRKLIEARAEYEKEVKMRIDESARAATINIRQRLESAVKKAENLEKAVRFRDGEIAALRKEISEKDAVWTEKIRNVERDKIARKVAEMESGYEDKKNRLEKEFSVYKIDLEREYQKKLAQSGEAARVKTEYLEKEGDALNDTINALRKDLISANQQISRMQEEMFNQNRDYNDKIINMEKEYYRDVESRLEQAVRNRTEILEEKLFEAQEQIVSLQKRSAEEIMTLKEAMRSEKERLMSEIDERSKHMEEAETKILALQDDLEKYRERGSGMLVNKLIDHEEQFARQIVEFNMKQHQLEKEYLKKVEELKKDYERRLEEQKKLSAEKDRLIGERENYIRDREREMAEMEMEFSRKRAEIESMRGELRKAVLEYKNRIK